MSENATLKSKTSPALIFAAFIIILAGIMYGESIVTSVLMALFVSIICQQPISWLQKRKVPKTLAILLVFIGIIAIFFFFGELIAASLSSFSDNAPEYEDNLRAMGASIFDFLNSKGINISFDKMSNILNPSKVMGLTANVLSEFGGVMGNTLTIVFLVLFMLLEVDSIPIKTKAVKTDTTDSLGYINVIAKNIRHYLSIKTSTSLITGLVIWIGLTIIGVDYAILWALIAFLLNYIPTIGSIIAAVPAVLFAAIQLGFGGAIGAGIVFLVANLVVGNIIEPKMMGKGLGLSTFVVFFSLLFWGFILGTVGMFLSVPLTMTIKIILEQNPSTKGIAIFMGTEEEAQEIVDQKQIA